MSNLNQNNESYMIPKVERKPDATDLETRQKQIDAAIRIQKHTRDPAWRLLRVHAAARNKPKTTSSNVLSSNILQRVPSDPSDYPMPRRQANPRGGTKKYKKTKRKLKKHKKTKKNRKLKTKRFR